MMLDICVISFGRKHLLRLDLNSYIRDIWDQAFAERFLLDLTRRIARIDDQPIDLEHPDQWVLVDL